MEAQAEQEGQYWYYLRMELERIAGHPRRVDAVIIVETTSLGEETASSLGRSLDCHVGKFRCHGGGGNSGEDCRKLHVFICRFD